MISIYSNSIVLEPSQRAAIVSDSPLLDEAFSELLSLQRGIEFDTRGYSDMMSTFAGKATPSEKLVELAKSLAPRNSEAVRYAAEIAPNFILERSELMIDRLRPQVPWLSLDRFRLGIIEKGLESTPDKLNPMRVAQTLFDIAERLGPVSAALVAGDFFCSAIAAPEKELG